MNDTDDRSAGPPLRIELAYATPERQLLLSVAVAAGTTAREAICHPALAAAFPAVDFGNCPVGVWGQPVADDHILKSGDRVEGYRPLEHDPRDARRELAREGRSMGGAGSDGG